MTKYRIKEKYKNKVKAKVRKSILYEIGPSTKKTYVRCQYEEAKDFYVIISLPKSYLEKVK